MAAFFLDPGGTRGINCRRFYIRFFSVVKELKAMKKALSIIFAIIYFPLYVIWLLMKDYMK